MQGEFSIDAFGISCILCIHQLKQADIKLYSYVSQLGNTIRRHDYKCTLCDAFQYIAQPKTNLHDYTLCHHISMIQALSGSANQCILGNMYLRSDSSRERYQT